MGMQSISIIGIGRVGGALALALARAGYRIEYLIHRGSAVTRLIGDNLPLESRIASGEEISSIGSDIILITTADPDIPDAAGLLARHLENRPIVLHTSGSLSSSILGELAAAGSSTGSMHPLVSISDAVSGAENFAGAYFCVEGDEIAVETARAIVLALGGQPFSIPSEQKPLYHASAVMACGHIVALIDVASEMLAECGMDRDTAKQVLFPLIASTIRNLEHQTPAEALTGSFARADVAALDRHLNSIDRSMSAAIRDVYLILGERSLDLAAANGVDANDIQRMRESIRVAKRKPE